MWLQTSVAAITLFLYILLGTVSFYHYFSLIKNSGRASVDDYNIDPFSDRFDVSRKVFFLVLGISAFLDSPLYVGCLALNGPNYCSWSGYSYSIAWIFHLIALCGYFFCLGIPLIIWSDIVSGKDGQLFKLSRSFNLQEVSKIGLHLSFFAYVLLITVQVATVLSTFGDSSDESFKQLSVNAVARCIESGFYAIIAMCWLIYGIRLQLFISNISRHNKKYKKIIVSANIVMTIVLLSYLMRAILIMSLSVGMFGFHDASDALHRYFLFWTAFTRWMPYVVCPFLLIFIMRIAGKGYGSGEGGVYGPIVDSSRSSDEGGEDDEGLDDDASDISDIIVHDAKVVYTSPNDLFFGGGSAVPATVSVSRSVSVSSDVLAYADDGLVVEAVGERTV